MKKARKFLLNTLILTATSLFLRTLGMGFSVYISNKIGAEGMGIYQLLLSIYSFGITLSLAGVSLATTRLVTEQLTRSSSQGAYWRPVCSFWAQSLLPTPGSTGRFLPFLCVFWP